MTNRTKWAAALVLVVLLWAVLYPNVFVLRDSLVADGAFSVEHYQRFSQSHAELRALWNSVWISTISVLLSAVIGVPLAFFFARYDFPARKLLRSEEHTSELQSPCNLVCRLLLEKKIPQHRTLNSH